MRTTLKDIAAEVGVSAVTVHKAIYNKPGISDEMRRKILKVAEQKNFSVNVFASSLKREKQNIAVVFPLHSRETFNYFPKKLWEGIEIARKELRDFHVALTPFPCGDSWQSQIDILEEISGRPDIHGAVVYCWDDTKLNEAIENLKKKNIFVVTVNSDAPASSRVGTVTAPCERIGALAAELLCRLIPAEGAKQVLVFSGNRMMKNIRENNAGFIRCMNDRRPDLSVAVFDEFPNADMAQEELAQAIRSFDGVAAVYSNSARNNIPMCRAIQALGLSGKVQVITSDVYEELYPFLEDGTVQATTWQDPQSQARKAVLNLHNFLTVQRMEKELDTVKIGLVFQNNFSDYL